MILGGASLVVPDLSLGAPDKVAAELHTVDACDARDSLTAVAIAQQAYLKASNTETFDVFGWSVSVSGDTVVVGAQWEASQATGVDGDQSDNLSSGAGAVYVFVRNGAAWAQQAYIKASNTEPPFFGGDEFGACVALSGDTLVVGAPIEGSKSKGVNGDEDNNFALASGAAYVFVRKNGSWSQQAYLKASNTDVGDEFGGAVAICGDTIVVGAVREQSYSTAVGRGKDDNSASGAGAAYVFVRNGTTWSQQAYLKASNSEVIDFFGGSVAVSGDTVLVGAAGEDSSATGVNGDQSDNSAVDSGAAYVFVRDGTTWRQQAYLKASNTDAKDFFGSVSVSGDTAVVGAWSEDSNATGVDGNQSDNSAEDSGASYVFVRNGTTWSQQAYLKASNANADDSFGIPAISGDILVVGALGEDSRAVGVNGSQRNNGGHDAGAAYVYVRDGTTWGQLAYLKASNTNVKDLFGGRVAVSGGTVVAGAYGESSSATGVDGDQTDNSFASAGAAYVFEMSGLSENDAPSLSLASGGQQVMTLDGCATRAGWSYWILGSVTGTSPGQDVGGVHVPINLDEYFQLTLTQPDPTVFRNFAGQLDPFGTGTAALVIPAGMEPSLAGTTLSHAYLAGPPSGGIEFSSNAVSVLLRP